MTTWTAERVAELKRLEATGISRSQIAASLGGVSRNAVIGKLLRLKLGEGYIPTPHKLRLKKVAVRVPSTKTHMKVKLICEPLPEENIDIKREEGIGSILELEAIHCRWPYGTENFYFCGKPHVDNSSYCQAHTLMSYRTTK